MADPALSGKIMETDRLPSGYKGMQPDAKVLYYRKQISELVAEAIQEVDAGRRVVLLTLADHWSALLRLRVGQGGRRAGG